MSTDSTALINELYEQDQSERLAVPWQEIDWNVLRKNDRDRLGKISNILEDKEIISRLDGETLFQLAMLLHHSEFDENVQRASEIAELAGNAGYKRGYWLKAAAEDRLLQRAGKPQKWGTQFQKNEVGKWEQYPLIHDSDSGVNDEMRLAHGLPPRGKQLETFLTSDSAT